MKISEIITENIDTSEAAKSWNLPDETTKTMPLKDLQQHIGLPKMKLHFIDIFPIYLSSIPMDVRLDSSTTITATATFRFKRYTLTTVVDGIW